MVNNKQVTVKDCKLVSLPKIQNRSGNITFLENSNKMLFDTKRIFYLYDIPGGESRGAHAHIECHQFIIAVLGSFEVHLDDGKNKNIIQLNQPFKGLYIPPSIWASEVNFSGGSICLVLASHVYEEGDYMRNYKDFLRFKKE